jgi:cation transport regulator ChaB
MPAKQEELPSTIARSPKKVQRVYTEALDNAHEQYGSEERAHRVALAAVKHGAEKQGDHWELKDEKGPVTRRARSTRARR